MLTLDACGQQLLACSGPLKWNLEQQAMRADVLSSRHGLASQGVARVQSERFDR